MADYNNYNNAPQYGAAPQPQYGAAPVAPAASEKKPIPTKIIAIAAAAVAALVLLIIIFGNGLPGKVEAEIKDNFDDMGIKVGSLKCEYKISKSGAKYYIISGRIKGATFDEDDEDYPEEFLDTFEDGYFIGAAIEYDGEVEFNRFGIFEKDDKDEFKEALKEVVKEVKEEKKEIKEDLEEIAEAIKEDDAELEDLF